eukprot:TRINITY_DN7833_c0_g3_i7.p1 TRINITY_DN7833_c0_g3~~TRINITY_DN7833_c0_g3_i7.p1  ORF type:complete len:100 (+),score=7.98 TRINITY_DN7833_c0_g3_i7:138-437(+)
MFKSELMNPEICKEKTMLTKASVCIMDGGTYLVGLSICVGYLQDRKKSLSGPIYKRLVLDGSKYDGAQWVEMKTRSRAIYVFGWDANFGSDSHPNLHTK